MNTRSTVRSGQEIIEGDEVTVEEDDAASVAPEATVLDNRTQGLPAGGGTSVNLEELMHLWADERSACLGDFRVLLEQHLSGIEQIMRAQVESVGAIVDRVMHTGHDERPAPMPVPEVRLNPSITREYAFKPMKYNGTEEWESYCLQFESIARKNEWDEDTKAVALGAALTGSAREVLAEVGTPCSYLTLKEAMEARFGHKNQEQKFMTLLMTRGQLPNENVATYHQAMKTLARRALPEVSRGTELMLVHLFVKGIQNTSLRDKVLTAGPKSMDEALEVAQRLEAVVQTPPVSVRCGELVEASSLHGESAEAVETSANSLVPVLRTQERTSDFRPSYGRLVICWRCSGPGHLARNCPHPRPMSVNVPQYGCTHNSTFRQQLQPPASPPTSGNGRRSD